MIPSFGMILSIHLMASPFSQISVGDFQVTQSIYRSSGFSCLGSDSRYPLFFRGVARRVENI